MLPSFFPPLRNAQLAPFPFDLIMREFRRFPGAEPLWCQEEPLNMGAYLHVQPRFQRCLEVRGWGGVGGWVGGGA